MVASEAVDPDPHLEYARKKAPRPADALGSESDPGWAVGFQDETWWSRSAIPSSHAWSVDGRPFRLV